MVSRKRAGVIEMPVRGERAGSTEIPGASERVIDREMPIERERPLEPWAAFVARARGRAPAPLTVALDADALPVGVCPICGHGSFHRPPEGPWACSVCAPPILPPSEQQAGWQYCCVGNPPEREELLFPPERALPWPEDLRP